jgi:hypothetical protein
MSFDADMQGPAQRYLVYGLQAAREVGDERSRLRAAGILADLAYQMRTLGHPRTAVRMIELALDQIPPDRRRFNAPRAELWALRAYMMSPMGLGYLPEVRSAISLSSDIYGQAQADEPSPVVEEYWPYATDAQTAGIAALTYTDLAVDDPSLAAEAERHAGYALANRADGFRRSQAFDQISLTRARFLGGEPEQACRDGNMAIELAAQVPASTRVTSRLGGLLADSAPYQDRPDVRDFRERLELTVAGTSPHPGRPHP